MMFPTSVLLIPKSDEHPWVMLVTIKAIVWLEQASLEHKPVNQVLMGAMTEVPELETITGRSPAVFKHWASEEVATEAILDWHGAETVTALEQGRWVTKSEGNDDVLTYVGGIAETEATKGATKASG
jgi:hypothetical protein